MKTHGFLKNALVMSIVLIPIISPVFGAREKPRVIIETDIGLTDGDDDASLVRLLLYADVLDIEGMIVTKSGDLNSRHGSIKDGFEFMEKFLKAYEEIRPNLVQHSVGLNHVVDPHPGWGSWSGRARQADKDATKDYPVPTERGNFWWYKKEKEANHDNYQGSINRDNCLKRWGLHIQNDFMARIEWCVKPYDEANHPPLVVVNGDNSIDVLRIKAKAGKVVKLDATGSSEPDEIPPGGD